MDEWRSSEALGRRYVVQMMSSFFATTAKQRRLRYRPEVLMFMAMKSDGPSGLVWGFHQAADGFEKGSDFFIVLCDAVLEFGELAGELLVGAEQLTQLDEGAHDIKADFDGAAGVEDAGDHHGAVFGEGVRAIARSAAPRV